VSAFHPLDWIAIGGYLVFALAVGSYLSKRASKSTQDFYLAGRSLPWWMAGTSLVATSFASDTPLVVTGWVRTGGIASNWIWWGFAVGGAMSFAFLAGWWRKLEVTTDAELIEHRYSGRPARILRGFYGAYHSLITNTLVLAWVLLAMLKVVRVVLDIDDSSSDVLIVGGAVVLAITYSILAGLWGVVVTDFFQFFLALGGAILLGWKAADALGGLDSAREYFSAMEPAKTALFPSPGEGGWTSTAWWTQGFTAFLVLVGLQGWANKNADGGGQAVQRYSACKSEGHARGAALWFHIAHYCLRPWPWIFVALCSLILIPETDLPQILVNGEIVPDHEAAYPMMMARYLGPGLFGLMCASFLAAFMSTLDTHLNLASAYAVNDLYRRFIRPEAKPQHFVNVGRVAELFVGILGASFALFAGSISNLFTFTLALLGGLGPAYLLRWFWWRANAWTEFSALITSGCMTVLLKFVLPNSFWPAAPFNQWQEGIPWDHSGQYLLVVGVSILVMVAVTLLTPPVDSEHLSRFHAKVRPFGFWSKVSQLKHKPGTVRAAFQVWFGGLALLLGLLMGTGTWLLGQPDSWVWFAIAATGSLLLKRSW
jgi:Na+/proline symporter